MISNKVQNRAKGFVGERMAQNYVNKLGYEILAINYKTNYGEIDIIAKDREVIVFIEVKYRKTLRYGRPSEAVTDFKQHKIRSVAQGYLIKNRLLNSYVRFDVLEIVDNEINYILNAF